MKVKHALGILSIAFLILGSGSTPRVAARTPPGSHLQLLRSDDQGVLLELTLDDFEVETVAHGGQTYHRLLIPDMVQTTVPGAPQVPTRGTLLGLPTTQGVAVQILAAEYEKLRGYRLYPAPRIEATEAFADNLLAGSVKQTFTLDQGLYATDAFYPGTPVELSHTGHMRDQAVAQVQFYPLQYNPVTGELRLYRRVLARVTWEAPSPAMTTGARGMSPIYESLLKNAVLNYGALERPSIAEQASPMPPPGNDIVSTADSTPTLKIGVTEDGLYELTYGDLTGAGLDLSGVDPRTIKLSNQGSEIPIYVRGEGDGVFTTDSILFYGTAITDVYTIKNVYWLTVGESNGQRMSMRNGTPLGATVLTRFPVTLHAEEDTVYWLAMPNGEGRDHWFWEDRISPSSSDLPRYRDYSLNLNNIATTVATATVRVRLQGFTGLDHRTKIYLNGHQIDDQTWSGQVVFDHEVEVDHAFLMDGTNTIRAEASDIGAVVDQSFVNWIEIDYWDTYAAEKDELIFGVPAGGTFQFDVAGFSDSDVQVFDVTNPASVAVITNTNIVYDAGSYHLQFKDTVELKTRYLALTSTQRKSAASIEMDQPSSWRSPGNGADYIIITHEDFYTSSLRLANHRNSASGLRVATVRVEDIYDEFNFGVFNPQAIRDFLSYAYHNWVSPAPIYVLLVGDATYDYRGNLGRVGYVPTRMIETDLLGQTPSDNWFVLVSGDDVLPDMFVGRLPADSVSQADNMVDKIIFYEQNPPDEPWNTNVLLVADDDEVSFESISEHLAREVPDYYTINRIYVAEYPPGDPTTDIADTINDGSILINFSGHGNVDNWGVWSGGRIFDNSDIDALSNDGRLPVTTVANCLNGFFVGRTASMAETFLKSQNKGAVAVWAPTGLSYASGHRTLVREFYKAIFQDDEYGLGAATAAAKVALYAQGSFWAELLETFVLFGDPAMQLGIPTNYPYVVSTTPADGDDDVATDQEIEVVFSKPMVTSTVTLGGMGSAMLPYTSTWNTGRTAVSYDHPEFGEGLTLTFSISGQDRLGNPLGLGLVPTTWSFTTRETFWVYLPLALKNR